MSVRRKSGTNKWIVDVRDRSTGYRTRRVVRSRKAGIDLESQIRQELKKRAVPQAGIEHALVEYLKGEAKTLKAYKNLLSKAKAIRPFIAGHTFESIGLVQAAIKKEMLGRGLKPATINRRLALLRRLANLAFEWGWIDYPAGKRIKLLSGETERHFYLTMDQVEEFVKKSPLTGSLIKIAAMTGLRRGELLSLQPEQIIDKQWIILNADTKTGKPRMVPIPPDARDLFDEYHWPLDNSYNQTLRNEFEDAREKLGLGHIHFHDLRHSYASFLIQAGADMKRLSTAMGHSSLQMTSRYAHLMDQHLMELAEKFGAPDGAPKK